MRTTATAVAVLAAMLAAAPAQAAPAPPLGHAGRWIVDAQGRVVILHGFNFVVKAAPRTPQQVGFDDDDAAFLAREGFNVVRLGIIYQAVEPQPGTYDDAYIDAIHETAQTLWRHGIFTLLDFHQDNYGPVVHGEGLPDWATLTDALPNPDLGFGGNYLGNPALERAYDNFWANAAGPGGVGLQDRYAAALAHVAQRFSGDAGLAGYDLFNEPWPGSAYPVCSTPPGCPLFDATLTEFSKRAIAGVRQADTSHLVWYEPALQFGFGAQTSHGAVGDPAAGFSFHDYCLAGGGGGAFPEVPANGDGCGLEEQMALDNAEAQFQRTGDALFNTEWGATDDLATLARMVAAQDRDRMSWAMWTYYNCCFATPVTQSIIKDQQRPPTADNVDQGKLAIVARPYPLAVAGTPQAWAFDAGTKTFTLTYTTARADGHGEFGPGVATEIAVPAHQYPAGAHAEVAGGHAIAGSGRSALRVVADGPATKVTVKVVPGRLPATSGRSGPQLVLRVKRVPHRRVLARLSGPGSSVVSRVDFSIRGCPGRSDEKRPFARSLALCRRARRSRRVRVYARAVLVDLHHVVLTERVRTR